MKTEAKSPTYGKVFHDKPFGPDEALAELPYWSDSELREQADSLLRSIRDNVATHRQLCDQAESAVAHDIANPGQTAIVEWTRHMRYADRVEIWLSYNRLFAIATENELARREGRERNYSAISAAYRPE